MPGANDTRLVAFEDWTLRVRPSENPKRLLLLIHGWTGDENSMWVFTRGLSADYWMIAPRALHPAQPNGFSWRPNDPETHGRPSFELLKPSAQALIRLVDEYASSVGVEALRFDLMGFSQGAALVNVIAALYPNRIGKMGVLAGFIPSGMDEILAAKPFEGKRVFVAHGAHDQLVPVERARASMDALERAGAQIVYCEDEVGHKVGANCLRALEEYLEE